MFARYVWPTAAAVLLAGCGGGGSGGATSTAPVPATPALPLVSFSIDNANPLQGDTTRLVWRATNSSNCQASGSWSGTLGTEGAQTITLNEAGSKNYAITCTGAGGSDSKSLDLTVQASKVIAGQIYGRAEGSSYGVNAEGSGLADVSVTIAGRQTTTQADGHYSVRVPVKLLASDAIVVSKAGYIKTEIARSMLDAGAAAINIGLYPVRTVARRSGFVAGIFTMDNGGHLNDIYNKGYFAPTYDRIRDKTGANLIAISDPVIVDAFDPVSASVKMSRNSAIPMLTRNQYAELSKLAHERGLQFMMQLGVFPAYSADNSKTWEQQLPFTVPSSNKSFWDAWFAAYKAKVLENTQYAMDFNIEYISLGMNHGFMTSQSSDYWKDIVGSMRALGYKGKILYQSMVSPSIDLYESNDFNRADAGKFASDNERIMAFVRHFDVLALNMYELSAKVNGSDSIPGTTLKANLGRVLGKYARFPVPLFVQLATPSVNDGLTTRDSIEPAAWFPTTRLRQVDLMAQADAYAALLEVVSASPTGNGNVMGVLSWGYYFVDNYRVEVNAFTKELNPDGTLVSYAGTNDEGAYDKSANVRGKPAESLLSWWFEKMK